ncbi:hypothetical protein BBP40_002228 [Aspergillus hancockii]|nr:hypothetical protein BBP40_002228 [Aspergillus hancockii]
MSIRLDVNLLQADEKAKKTNCIPLKDFDISNKDLSNIQTTLTKYGELGSRLFLSKKFSALGTKTKKEAARAMKAAASVLFSSKYVSGSASYGQEDQSNSRDNNPSRTMQSAISWQAQGGDTLLPAISKSLVPRIH